MTIKEKVQELARQRNMTIAELERNTGIANGTIGKWNRQNPSLETLQKISDYFNVSTDYLLGRTDDPSLSHKEVTPEFSSIQRKAEQLSKHDQQRLLQLMEITFDSISNGEYVEEEDDDL